MKVERDTDTDRRRVMTTPTKEDIVAIIRDNMLDGSLDGVVSMSARNFAEEVAGLIMEQVFDVYEDEQEPVIEDPDPDGPRYPDVYVQLTGEDGNAGAIMDRVVRGLRAAKVPLEQIQEYRRESMSGNYANLLATAERWVTVS